MNHQQPSAINRPPDITRASLLLRLKTDGESREVAWGEFYEVYVPVIGAFARRMGAANDEVEELTQEIMISFFRVSPEFSYDPDRGRFRGYLKTCVTHKLRELRKRRLNLGLTTKGIAEMDDVAVEATWNDVWETEKLHRALGMVRERYSVNSERLITFRAFEMCTLLDRSVEEVAGALNLSLESVRAAKSRVSKALRQTFEELDGITG